MYIHSTERDRVALLLDNVSFPALGALVLVFFDVLFALGSEGA